MAEDIEILDRENGGVSDFINILEHGKELYQEIKRSMFSASFVEAEHLNMQTEQFVTTIVISFGHLRNTLLQDANMIETIATLINMFQCLVRRLMDRFETSVYDDLQYNCPNVCSEGRGRPQLLIPKEQLEESNFVQRWRVRQSIWRIDPDSRMLRCRKITKRRLYNVPTPNSLWHLDGQHKLIRWRIVIHGCVDGYSRAVVF
ncbi:uncharacterized protein LOC124459241 [Xenia sp. Carnegie-2017]|uniref:uncharacterized protein LOC124459241 n=1 Tax=Xenia sp. Carnegie-2017 TaxID=2897299 RepID=UPI001F0354F7|nr:uncharacterized protein LOC124459241 [Xenia sp. Carnegie-2017]